VERSKRQLAETRLGKSGLEQQGARRPRCCGRMPAAASLADLIVRLKGANLGH